MLKRIAVKQLRLGMYIQEIGCAWNNHPFWRKSFLLEDNNDLNTLLSTRIEWLSIDTAKGFDVVETDLASSKDSECEPVDKKQCSQCWQPKQVSSATTAPVKTVQRVHLAEEAALAVKVCNKSKQAVTSMFLEARMGQALDADAALPIVEEISSSVQRNPGALISLARLKNKDDYTYMHSVAVCALMVALATKLKLTDEKIRHAGLAGLLHDIGKMMIPSEILDKPGKLSDAEFTAIKSHPAEGYKLLVEGNGVSDIALDVCLHHHEKMNGLGYPDKLPGNQISLYAKMGAVCDVYDAITSDRPYKKGWEPAESIRKMASWCEGHFDPVIFQAFVKTVGIYPVGSLVKLESKRLAVIIEQSDTSLLKPIVMIFFSIKSDCRIPLETLDLAKPACTDKITSHEDPEKWGVTDINELWSGITPTW